MSTDLKEVLSNLPKIELHRHLEGSIRPATIADICQEHKIELPTYDAAELANLIQLSKPADNLAAFLEPLKLIKFCFADKEAISRIAYEVVEDAHIDNVRYLELRFAPDFMAFCYGLSLRDVMDGIVEGVNLAARRFGITAKLIVSLCRDHSPESRGPSWPSATEVASVASDYADRGVVGFDLSGVESGFPPELFKEPFGIARRAGLGITVHAGEDAGPESIRGAIECLGATRIGHGVHIVRDPEVLRLAMDRDVTFEVCPTSNVLTRAVESLENHPVRQMYEAGLPVTINTDDPIICGVTLTDEYVLIAEKFGFTLAEIERLIENARQAAFFQEVNDDV